MTRKPAARPPLIVVSVRLTEEQRRKVRDPLIMARLRQWLDRQAPPPDPPPSA